MSSGSGSRRFLVPEVVQTSGMDCGPASLKCLLEGFGTPVSYGRLREACQTDVDGTSISTLEQVAVSLGLDAEEIMLPVDHILLPEANATPSLIVVRLPNGFTHFVVLWRQVGRWVQIMDPARGRIWRTRESFLGSVFRHRHPVPADGWREWAGSDEFQAALSRRIRDVGADPEMIAKAARDAGWRSLAALDAAVRMVAALVSSGGLSAGREAAGVLSTVWEAALADGPITSESPVPESYWSVLPADDGETLVFSGAVLLRIKGRVARTPEETAADPALSPELRAALGEARPRPWREILALVGGEGVLAPATLASGLALAAAGTAFQVILFRALFDLVGTLGPPLQRATALAAILALMVLLLILELPLALEVRRLGRRLETRLRLAFQGKLPHLPDRYFRSRPTSDMADRAHSIHRVRSFPVLAGRTARLLFEMLMVSAGLIWLDPASAPLVLGAALASTVIPLLAQQPLTEADLKLRTHTGALSRFYLDSFLGQIAIRTHSAQRAVRRQHENLLVSWAGASRERLATSLFFLGVHNVLGFALAIAMLFSYFSRSPDGAGLLLYCFWALRLPGVGRDITMSLQSIPGHNNLVLRLLEPLGATADPDPTTSNADSGGEASSAGSRGSPSAEIHGSGTEVRFEDVSVVAGGHRILESITATLPSGSHVAVVGRSGAGKSSLVGLLLGWHRPSRGRVLADGVVPQGSQLDDLRSRTAWLDPSIQIWNQPLLANLQYGAPSSSSSSMGRVIDAARLVPLLEGLPDGLQTFLGEGGGLVSGGEGQRVRYGRALMRGEARLVILDEPFRGLDRSLRRQMLAGAREHWKDATLICITHDMEEARSFDRVLVIEGGRLVEDDAPESLLLREGSRYRAMSEAEEGMWDGVPWRRLELQQGRLRDEEARS